MRQNVYYVCSVKIPGNGDYTMKNGACPKCGSKEVYTMQDGIGSAEFQYIRKGGIGMSSTTFDCYLCMDCGYFENYVSNRQHLDAARSSGRWKRT